MIEAAPKDLSLAEALDLSYQAVDFSVIREMVCADEYAETELRKFGIPLPEGLFDSVDLYDYGKALMVRNLAVNTNYGILCTRDGMTVEQCLGRVEPSQGMKMG